MKRTSRPEGGQALLEFALVGLIFMIVVVGLVELGRAVWNYNTLAHAAREGARYAIVHGSRATEPSGPGSTNFTLPDQDAAVTETVRGYASGLDLTDLTVSAEWPDGTNERGRHVRVTARYEYQPMFSNLLHLPGITLTSTSIMTITY